MGDNEDQANEAISAVVDDGLIGEDEDEDDDYEDLYNDVNVGENFLHSFSTHTDDVENPDPKPEKLPDPPPLPPPLAPPEVSTTDRDTEGVKETDPRASDRVADEEEEAKRVNDVAPPAGNGTMRINLDQQAEQTVNTNSNLSNQVTAAVTSNNVRQGVNGGGGGGAMLFVGDLHWWTTDSEVETELCKYGAVKEVRFFDEKASGKSKGYAQVEFHDASSANACKEGMNGFVFNGRACVVAFASPFSIKRMGEAQMNRTTNLGSSGGSAQGGGLGPVRRDGPLSKPMGNNGAPTGGYQDNINNNNSNFGNNNNRGGFGRGNWGRGNGQGMGTRGGPIRNRPMMGRGMMGNGFGGGSPMMPPQAAMMGQGFDPSFGGPMGRMGGYGGGFPGGPNPPFSGMMSFPPVGGVGLPGVAPHVNPAFFGRGMGMGMNGMGMMPSSGVVDGSNNMGMWGDPNYMGGWGGEEHGGRVAESSYAEEAVSDHQYGEVSRGGSGRSNAVKEKDREWSGSSDKKYRDDRDTEYEREMPREKEAVDQEWQEPQQRRRDDRDVSRERERGGRERSRERDRGGRDRHRDERGERYSGDHHRYKDRGGEQDYDDEWDNRGRSSRGHNKSRLSQDEGQHFRSRDADYSKRRRLTSE